jgi:hypothetical protein
VHVLTHKKACPSHRKYLDLYALVQILILFPYSYYGKYVGRIKENSRLNTALDTAEFSQVRIVCCKLKWNHLFDCIPEKKTANDLYVVDLSIRKGV